MTQVTQIKTQTPEMLSALVCVICGQVLLPSRPVREIMGGMTSRSEMSSIQHRASCFFQIPLLFKKRHLPQFPRHEIAGAYTKQADGLSSGIGAAHEFASGGADGGGVRGRNGQ